MEENRRLIIDLTSASVAGMEHLQPGMPTSRNNQDAVAIRYAPGKGAVAIVCDGCGSKGNSELGAMLGARYLAQQLFSWHVDNATPSSMPIDWEFVARDLIHTLWRLARTLGSDIRETIIESFLFTITGFMITPEWTHVFHFGDGVEMVNDEVTVLGPFLKDPPPHLVNAPPYVMYREIGSEIFDLDPSLRHFKARRFPTSEIRTVGVGSDGMADLAKAEEKTFPGTETKVGPLMQIFNDPFFANPDHLRRHLAKANRVTVNEGKIRRGLLDDDTTAALARIRWETEETERHGTLDTIHGI